jgi:hypothetical protein
MRGRKIPPLPLLSSAGGPFPESVQLAPSPEDYPLKNNWTQGHLLLSKPRRCMQAISTCDRMARWLGVELSQQEGRASSTQSPGFCYTQVLSLNFLIHSTVVVMSDPRGCQEEEMQQSLKGIQHTQCSLLSHLTKCDFMLCTTVNTLLGFGLVLVGWLVLVF